MRLVRGEVKPLAFFIYGKGLIFFEEYFFKKYKKYGII